MKNSFILIKFKKVLFHSKNTFSLLLSLRRNIHIHSLIFILVDNNIQLAPIPPVPTTRGSTASERTHIFIRPRVFNSAAFVKFICRIFSAATTTTTFNNTIFIRIEFTKTQQELLFHSKIFPATFTIFKTGYNKLI